MRLADFIHTHRAPILTEWEAFARTCAPASGTMDVVALRDHADAMLTAFAADLETPENTHTRAEKSKGCGPGAGLSAEIVRLGGPDGVGADTAAGEHGAGRAVSGYSMQQMVAEYRALRASVLRLWTNAEGSLTTEHIEDLTRFNEAVDQALAESVARFDASVEQAKETFLAILGHDLRTPLGAIQTSAAFLLDTDAMSEPGRPLAARIAGSARRAVVMVGDLLDFTRGRLGGGIPVVVAEVDLRALVRDVVAETAAAYPGARICVGEDAAAQGVVGGALLGRWDAARLGQALGNLIGNAVQHGAPGGRVTVTVRAEAAGVAIAVHNSGAAIAPDQLDGLFNPMKGQQASRPADRGPTGSLGLGLYIAERIVAAHDGRLAVESSDTAGTTFTIHLPRGARPMEGTIGNS